MYFIVTLPMRMVHTVHAGVCVCIVYTSALGAERGGAESDHSKFVMNIHNMWTVYSYTPTSIFTSGPT